MLCECAKRKYFITFTLECCPVDFCCFLAYVQNKTTASTEASKTIFARIVSQSESY
jgi:hypothetical protein